MKWTHGHIGFLSLFTHHQQELSRDFALDRRDNCQFAKVPTPLGCFLYIEVSVSFSVSMYQMASAFLLKKMKKEIKFPTYVYTKRA